MRIPVMSADISLYKSEIPYRSNGACMVSGGITPQWDCMSLCLDSCLPRFGSLFCQKFCWNRCHVPQYVDNS
jgi:hypothetical protein